MYKFYNEDCITGAVSYIPDDSVDLIISDPPYGIDGANLHKHYNRKENYVIDGYIEVPLYEYETFSNQWIAQAARILKPGGCIYIVSGYTNLHHVLGALKKTDLKELNHIIWKYNFGVYTKKKFVSSHYHILFYKKPGAAHTFNTFSRFSDSEKDKNQGSLNYQDREDVWIINREYKPGKVKNKNELPTKLLMKMMQYSSNQGHMVCDMFLGSFSTAKVAKGLNRKCIGFEKSKTAFEYQIQQIESLPTGYLLESLRKPEKNKLYNAGSKISDSERENIIKQYNQLIASGLTQKKSIQNLSEKFGRGYFSIARIIKNSESQNQPIQDLFL